MGIIDPPVGAIQNFRFVEYQEGIVGVLRAVASVQAGFNPEYDFDVLFNKYAPEIADLENGSFVNVRIGPVDPGNSTRQRVNHEVTFFLDCYVLGENESDPEAIRTYVPADEVAVQRLQYLTSMVLFGLTSLNNYYMGLTLDGENAQPGKIDFSFSDVEDATDAATPVAPARFRYKCTFPYTPESLTGLPDLSTLDLDSGIFGVQVDNL